MTQTQAISNESEDESPTVPHILLADDDSSNLVLLRRLLERDYKVTAVRSGDEAMALLSSTRFQLAILDVVMGHTDGLQVLSFIRQMPENADLPVILISAMAQPEDVVRGLEMGANDYITKPFDIMVVRARVERQILIKQALDERQAIISALQDAQTAKDNLFHIATHDLKSPLNNIRLAQYYLRDIVGQDPTAATALDAIEETVDWMNSLVQDFLDASMLKNGKAELQLQPTSVAEVAWQVIDRYGPAANRKNVMVVMGEMPGLALADPARLSQIIGNLLGNAIKYSPSGTCVALSSEVRGDRVRISVADEGPGIPPAERENLFTAFSRSGAPVSDGEKSSGLGLWIVKELVELHRGEVGLVCPPDGGSIFWVEIPRWLTPDDDQIIL
ncbi:MAG: response regulator [Chloroflexi bacterium]|nr:response regulator [Chloroflexota bacterium]